MVGGEYGEAPTVSLVGFDGASGWEGAAAARVCAVARAAGALGGSSAVDQRDVTDRERALTVVADPVVVGMGYTLEPDGIFTLRDTRVQPAPVPRAVVAIVSQLVDHAFLFVGVEVCRVIS